MKVTLEGHELANLVNDWARRQYKTNNVASYFTVDNGGVIKAEIEVTLSNVDMNTYQSSVSDGFASQLAAKLSHSAEPETLDFSAVVGDAAPI